MTTITKLTIKIKTIYPEIGQLYFYGPTLLIPVNNKDLLNKTLVSDISKLCKKRCILVAKPENLWELQKIKDRLTREVINITYGGCKKIWFNTGYLRYK